MLSLAEAQRIVIAAAERLCASTTPIEKACGYTLSEDIISEIDVSPFRNSAMDGFAVSAKWLKDCSADNPITLPIGVTVFAGHDASGAGSSGPSAKQAISIMTGAPVPEGFDAVVKIENAGCDGQSITFSSNVSAGTNIREPGEDIRRGELLFSAGHSLGTMDIGMLAGVGIKRAPVYCKPTLRVITTGNELVEPGEALQPGQIYNSNQYTIASLVGNFCGRLDTPGVVNDSMEKLSAALNDDSDVIISTGGVSAGERDYVIRAAESTGWHTVFHKVSIKPGKPLYFARRNSQLLFGLPGNPLSAAVTCAMFVLPVLKKMMGRADYQMKSESAHLESAARKAGGRTLIWPGKIFWKGPELYAELSHKKSSASLTALLQSDGLIIQNANVDVNETPEVDTLTWEQILK